jgi:tetratricopeptide (TPR) repeat protein
MTNAQSGDAEIAAALNDGDLPQVFALIERELNETDDPHRRFNLHLTRGRLRMVVDDPGLAFPDLDSALTLASSVVEQGSALLARAEASESVGDIDRARTDLTSLLDSQATPLTLASAQQVLGRIERDHGSLARAIELLTSARDHVIAAHADHDRQAEATLDLAMALRLAGETRQSISLLEGIVSEAEPELAARVIIQIGTTWGFEGRYDLALDSWERALPMISDASDRAAVRYNRAVAYREMGDHEAARAELGRALIDNAGMNRRVEFDALLLLGVVEREAGDVRRSLEHLVEAADLIPEGDPHGRARLEVGATMATTGLFGPAIEELGIAIHLCQDPHDRARARRYRGLARQEMGQLDGAIDDFSAAVELTIDPDERARDALTLSALLVSAGRRNDGLSALDIALASARDPKIVRQLYAQRGAMRAESGDLDGAIGDLERAAARSADAGDNDLFARTLADLGAIYVAVGREGQGQASFEKAAELARSGPVAHAALLNLGNLLMARGEPLQTLAAFERAAAAAEDDRDARAAAFLARGNAALRFRRYRQAEADFARVLTLQPNQALHDSASIGHHTTQQHLQNLEQMRAELTRVIQAHEEPSFRAAPTLQRGLIALQLGDADAAIIDLTRATRLARLKPEQALAHAHLALAYAHLGQCAEAVTELNEATSLDPERAWLATVQGDIDWRACRGYDGFPEELIG